MSKSKIKESTGLRLAIVAVLTLLLMIPAGMVQSLVRERQQRRDEAIDEMSQKWGGRQTISGPILGIPFNCTLQSDEGKSRETKYIYLLPETLQINAKVAPEIRYRGIYEAILYQSEIEISGSFKRPNLAGFEVNPDDVLWQKARLLIGISDSRGFRELVDLDWAGKLVNPEFGSSTDLGLSGIGYGVEMMDAAALQFSTRLKLNGTERLAFCPRGRTNDIALTSAWPNPGFDGEFLPDSRRVDQNGFTAAWKISEAGRRHPQVWIGDHHDLLEGDFGVSFLIAVAHYQKTMRTAKYAIIFISLTFLAFFMIELFSDKKLHPVHYLLIGFALLVFYSLLLSVAEHLSFNVAYCSASLAVLLLVASYTRSILASVKQAVLISLLLAFFYSYLFVVLQLQDYALLIGSLGLFVILATVMFVTRKVDWFSVFAGDVSTLSGQ